MKVYFKEKETDSIENRRVHADTVWCVIIFAAISIGIVGYCLFLI